MSTYPGSQFPVSFAQYVDPPRIGATYCGTVARQLLNSMRADASPEEKRAMRLVVECSDGVEDVINERERAGVGKVRPAMLGFANAWSGGLEVLSGFSRVEGEVGTDAKVLLETAFSDGVAFVKLDARRAWFEGHRRLGRIDEESLGRKLTALLGETLVAQIRAATASLGNAIGAGTEQRSVPSTTALAEKVATFARAVAAYCRIAAAKVDENDAASIERFMAAMAPLDEYRASRKGSTDEEEDDTEVPTPVTNGAPGMPTDSPFITP